MNKSVRPSIGYTSNQRKLKHKASLAEWSNAMDLRPILFGGAGSNLHDAILYYMYKGETRSSLELSL